MKSWINAHKQFVHISIGSILLSLIVCSTIFSCPVIFEPLNAIYITPSQQNICAGECALFTAMDELGYEVVADYWQLSVNGGQSWQSIPNSAVSKLVASEPGLYRCVLCTGGYYYQPLISNEATLILNTTDCSSLGKIFVDMGTATLTNVEEEAAMEAQDANGNGVGNWAGVGRGDGPRYSNIPASVPFYRTFSGCFTPLSDDTEVALFSDDGVDVYVDGVQVLSRKDVVQSLADIQNSFSVLNYDWTAGQTYNIVVEYSNVGYAGIGDLDGCTMFAYSGGGYIGCPPPTPPDTGIIYVTPQGNDTNPNYGHSWDYPKKSISAAIIEADAGNQIWVATGTYKENITLKPGVSIYGGFAGWESSEYLRNWKNNLTKIEGDDQSPVVSAVDGDFSETTFSGFNIEYGRGEKGGGIYCVNASPEISNNAIAWCNATDCGAGIYLQDSNAKIYNNEIKANTSNNNGSGIYCLRGTPDIINNTIVANDSAIDGSCIFLMDSSPQIANNIIALNNKGIKKDGTSSPTLETNCIWNNSKSEDDEVGLNDLELDPKICLEIFQNKDTHLLEDSDCRDAGTDSYILSEWRDMDGESRKYGTHVDIGADEYGSTRPSYLAVQPSFGMVCKGSPGGPYNNTSKIYTLSNPGTSRLYWTAETAMPDQTWIRLSPTAGWLESESNTEVQVSIDQAALTSLTADMAGAIIFGCDLPDSIPSTREVYIDVCGANAGTLQVTPTNGISSSGSQYPYTPSSQDYVLTNTGTEPINWSVTTDQTWITLSPRSGVLQQQNDSTTVTVGISEQDTTGSFNGTVTFWNTTENLNTIRVVDLLVYGPFELIPNMNFVSSGSAGGPFTPASAKYYMKNPTPYTLTWTASVEEQWLTLSGTSGTLVSGSSQPITVALNNQANLLKAGTYEDELTITTINTQTSEEIGYPVSVTLSVTGSGPLLVTPNLLTFDGYEGVPFTVSEATLQLTNGGDINLNWTASVENNSSWLNLSKSSGVLIGSNASDNITVSLSGVTSLRAGTYKDNVILKNIDTNNTVKVPVTLNIEESSDAQLIVTPNEPSEDDWFIHEWLYGSYTSASKTYTLTNTSRINLEWSATTKYCDDEVKDWLTVGSGAGGTIAAHSTANVTISFNDVSKLLGIGSHVAVVSFVNLTSGVGNTTRHVLANVKKTGSGWLSVLQDDSVDYEVTGREGGPFNPLSKTYTLINDGGQALDWTATNNQQWLGVSQASGTLQPGWSSRTTVTVNLVSAEAALLSGCQVYHDKISFTDVTDPSNHVETTRNARLKINSNSPCFCVEELDDANFYGPLGGEFIPAMRTYTLTNTGDERVSWQVTKSTGCDWISVLPDTGFLEPGESTKVSISTVSTSTVASVGQYSGTLSFVNTTAQTTVTTRTVYLDVSNGPVGWSLTPNEEFSCSGMAFSTFRNETKSYTLTNQGQSILNWSIVKRKGCDWFSISSPTSGSLDVNQSTTITLSMNTIAEALVPSFYYDCVDLVTQGRGYDSRVVKLEVRGSGAGPLAVSDDEDFTVIWPYGGLISSISKVYALSNCGSSAINWTASTDQNWVKLLPTSGNLVNGTPANVTVSFASTATQLTAGKSYTGTVAFSNNTNHLGDQSRRITLVKLASGPGILEVKDNQGWNVTGPVGGPFVGPDGSETKTYTLTNCGSTTLHWTASSSENWVSLSGGGGDLLPGKSVEVVISLNDNMTYFPGGSYLGFVTFLNTTNHNGDQGRTISLTIGDPASRTIVRVSPTGSDSNSGDAWSNPKKTIQAAIDSVYDSGGGEVWVKEGIYNGSILVKPFVGVYGGFTGSESRRESRNWAKYTTVLDGVSNGSVVSFRGGSGRVWPSVLDGFTIRGGRGTVKGDSCYGGGIYCDMSSPNIMHNIIRDNLVAGSGVVNSKGGGIYCSLGSPTIIDNAIVGNSVSQIGYGGGAYFVAVTNSNPVLRNNTVVGNNALYGGGVYLVNCDARIVNNLIASNNCTTGIYGCGTSSQLFQNNNVWGHSQNYAGSITAPTGNGNISSDPKLSWDNIHLRANADSPCVDMGGAGVVSRGELDLDHNDRVNGDAVDIGAVELSGCSSYSIQLVADKTSVEVGGDIYLTATVSDPSYYNLPPITPCVVSFQAIDESSNDVSSSVLNQIQGATDSNGCVTVIASSTTERTLTVNAIIVTCNGQETATANLEFYETDDWLTHRHDFMRTGCSYNYGRRAASLEQVWSVSAPISLYPMIDAPLEPTVVGNKVIIGALNKLIAFNAQSGAKVWERPLNPFSGFSDVNIICSPCVDKIEDQIYVAGSDGTVRCYDIDGNYKWAQRVISYTGETIGGILIFRNEEPPQPGWPLTGIYVTVGGSFYADPKICNLNPNNGSILQTCPIVQGSSYRYVSEPSLAVSSSGNEARLLCFASSNNWSSESYLMEFTLPILSKVTAPKVYGHVNIPPLVVGNTVYGAELYVSTPPINPTLINGMTLSNGNVFSNSIEQVASSDVSRMEYEVSVDYPEFPRSEYYYGASIYNQVAIDRQVYFPYYVYCAEISSPYYTGPETRTWNYTGIYGTDYKSSWTNYFGSPYFYNTISAAWCRVPSMNLQNASVSAIWLEGYLASIVNNSTLVVKNLPTGQEFTANVGKCPSSLAISHNVDENHNGWIFTHTKDDGGTLKAFRVNCTGGGGSLQAPTINPSSGTFSEEFTAYISGTGEIHYTVDGREPTQSSPSGSSVYITGNTTLRAKAWSVSTESDITTVNYSFKAPTPSFSPDGGTYGPSLTVSITDNSGGDIYYTLDGSEPNPGSNKYIGPFAISSVRTTKVLKAKVFKTDWYPSDTKTATFTITGKVADPVFSEPDLSVFDETTDVTLTCSTPGATIRYTTNGSEPSSSSSTVTSGGTVKVDRTMVLKAQAVLSGWDSSNVVTANYTVTGDVEDPVLTPASGTSSNRIRVTVTCATPYVKICYTTESRDPVWSDNSVCSGDRVSISKSSTLRVKAFRQLLDGTQDLGWTPSDTVSGEYEITGTVTSPVFSQQDNSTFTEPRNVFVWCTPSDAKIYYTEENRDPDPNLDDPFIMSGSSIYVDHTVTLKAKGFKDNWNSSGVTQVHYTVTGTVATPTFNPSSGSSFTTPTDVQVSCTTQDPKTIRYTIDGTEPVETSPEVQNGVIPITGTVTVKARAFKQYWAPSSVATASYTYTGKVATPVFDYPSGEVFADSTYVTVTCSTEGATIYYTDDESTPTTSDNEVGEDGKILVTNSVVLKAKAFLTNWDDSDTTTVHYYIGDVVTTPSFTVLSGTYDSPQTVEITCEQGAEIRYTLDGSEPTKASSIYSNPIVIDSNKTLRAKGFKTGCVPSLTASATYVITIAAPTFDPLGGQYDSSVVVSLECATYGASIRYTLSEAIPELDTGFLYTSPITRTETTTITARAFKTGQDPSPAVSQQYVVRQLLNKPTFIPEGGTYTKAQEVRIEADEGAYIYYTIDNSDPTTSSWLYDGKTIEIKETTTLKAIAVKEGSLNSAISTAEYVITGKVAQPVFSPLPGTYPSAQTITISVPAEASVYYTIDGTVPTKEEGTLYQGQFAIDRTKTLKAKAFRDSWDDSDITSGRYVILDSEVDTPEFTPRGGTYVNAQEVYIECDDPLADIYYTDDDTIPTQESIAYTRETAIPVNSSKTLRAKAFKGTSPVFESDEAIEKYTITNQKVDTPTFTPNGGDILPSSPISIDCGSPTPPEVMICYTLNGTEPTKSSRVYNGPITINASATIKAKAFRFGYEDSNTASAVFNIIGDIVATPVIDPNGCTDCTSAVTVTITSETDAKIHYTLGDGSEEPTASSTLYTGPFVVSRTTTLKAKAYKQNKVPSNTTTAVFNFGSNIVPDLPVPGWAMNVVPMDSVSSAGNGGPSSADSVNLASGTYGNDPGPDIVVTNPWGPSVSYERLYRSSLAKNGVYSSYLSPGWMDNFQVKLQAAQSGNNLLLVYPDGSADEISPVLDVYGNPDTTYGAAILNPVTKAPYFATGSPIMNEGQWTGRWDWVELKYADESTSKFVPCADNNDIYRLYQIADLAGSPVTVAYVGTHPTGYVCNVNDPLDGAWCSGNEIMHFTYDSDKLQRIDDCVSGQKVEYLFQQVNAYNWQCMCLWQVSDVVPQSVTSMPLHWQYTYDINGSAPWLRNVSVPSVSGSGLTSNLIDVSTDGRVNSLTDANGNVRQYSYSGYETTISASDIAYDGTNWSQKIGACFENVGTIDADGNQDYIQYIDHKPVSITNKSNQTTLLTYDDYGSLTCITAPDNTFTAFTYNTQDTLKRFRLTQIDSGIGTDYRTPTRFTYDQNGRLETVSTPRPGGVHGSNDFVTTTFAYRDNGNLETVTSPGSNDEYRSLVTKYEYGQDGKSECMGMPTTVKVFDGTEASGRLIYRVGYGYDENGRVTRVTDAKDNITDIVYDDTNSRVWVYYPATGDTGTGRAVTGYKFGSNFGPLLYVTEWDESDTLVKQVDYSNGPEYQTLAQSGDAHESSVVLDSFLRVREQKNGNGNTTEFDYDPVGNLKQLIRPMKNSFGWDFDADGNPVAYTDGKQAKTEYARSQVDNRVVEMYRPDNEGSVRYEYDSYGRLASMVQTEQSDGVDKITEISYEYDDNDLVTSVTTTYDNQAPEVIDYEYYPDGSIKSIDTKFGSYTYSYGYETWGSQGGLVVGIHVPWQNGTTRRFCNYDQSGNLIKEGYNTSIYTDYSYNSRGFMTSMRNYNQVNATEEPAAPSWYSITSEFTNMHYDALGNLVSMVVDMPEIGVLDDYYAQVTYNYNNKGELTGEERRTCDSEQSLLYSCQVEYDSAGNPINVSRVWDDASSETYDFDYDENECVAGLAGWEYDYNDNPLAIKPDDERTYQFDYNSEDSVTAIRVGDGHTTTTEIGYRPDGLRAWKKVGGKTTYFYYNGDQLLYEVVTGEGTTSTYAYGYTPNGVIEYADLNNDHKYYEIYQYDPMGSLTTMTYRSGATTYGCKAKRRVIYDAWGMVLESTINNTGTDYNDNPSPVGYLGKWGVYSDQETRLDALAPSLYSKSVYGNVGLASKKTTSKGKTALTTKSKAKLAVKWAGKCASGAGGALLDNVIGLATAAIVGSNPIVGGYINTKTTINDAKIVKELGLSDYLLYKKLNLCYALEDMFPNDTSKPENIGRFGVNAVLGVTALSGAAELITARVAGVSGIAGETSSGVLRDFSTKDTLNIGREFSSIEDAADFALRKLGNDYSQIAKGKIRSSNGRWQFRGKPNDISGAHGKGSHLHLEELDPNTGRVIRNYHLYYKGPK